MLSIKTNNEHAVMPQAASLFDNGDLFRDIDGDLYLRLPMGAIRFEGDQMYGYFESDLDEFSFFNQCTLAPGDIIVNINLR